MNQFVPDWSTMGDLSRPLGEDDDLVELLWCNGHVVMQSQSHRPKQPPVQRAPEKASPPAGAAQEDEAGLWFPFALADSLDKDIFSELFYEAPVPVPVAATGASAGVDGGKSGRDAVPVVDERRGGASAVTEAPRDLMPPPRSTHASGSRQQTISLEDAGGLSDLVRARTPGSAPGKAAEAGASSSMLSAIGPSVCGSNQVQVQRAAEQCRAGRASDTAGGGALPSAVGSANAKTSGRGHEATVASSSGRQSSYRFGATTTTTTTGTEPTSTSNLSSKRKRLDTTTDDYSESPSEDAESESAALARKPTQKLSSARRSRAAEVHNLSERRRRDRINEKMRALQELIPHCNKTDKASMLDEAIEYLKTLQMQMMWMGGGMAPPVMFPGVHQYLPRMGVGMGAAGAMPRMAPFMAAAQPVVPASAAVNAIPMGHAGSPACRGHMPGVSMPNPYAHYLGVNHLQPQPGPSQHYAQGMSYYPLGAKAVQQNPTLHMAGGSMPAAAATTPAALPSENQPNTGSG